MAYPVPTAVPAIMRAGDTVTWKRSLSDYPASDGWSLSYALVRDGVQIIISSAASGTDHLVAVPVATSNTWSPGVYHWLERVTKGAEAYTIASGTTEIIANLSAAASGFDARTHAEKALAAIEAWIEGRDLGVAEYQIGDRQLKNIPIPDLLKLRDAYRREVRYQAGKSSRIYMRF